MESRPAGRLPHGRQSWPSEKSTAALTTGMDSRCTAAGGRGDSRGAAIDSPLPVGRILYRTSTGPLLILYFERTRPNTKAALRNPLTRRPAAVQRQSPRLDVVSERAGKRPDRPKSSTRPLLILYHCTGTSAYRPTPLFLLPLEREPNKPDYPWLFRLSASRVLKRRAPPPTAHRHPSRRAPRSAKCPGICCLFRISHRVCEWAQNQDSAPTDSAGLVGPFE